MNKPRVSVVLGTFDRLPYLKMTVESVRKELADTPHEIIVIDGGSSDGTLDWLAKQKDVLTVIQHNRGYWRGQKIERRSWGYFMNLGFKAAQGKYVCMLSDDCLVVPGAIRKGCDYFDMALGSGQKVGAVAFYWRNWPEEKKYSVYYLGDNMYVNHGLYLKQALEDVGYIDEVTYSFYHADGDLCLEMFRKGYVCLASPDSYIEHFNHANLSVRISNTTGSEIDWQKFLRKWQGIIAKYDFSSPSKEYQDPYRTAEQFRRVDPFSWHVSRRLVYLKKAIVRTKYLLPKPIFLSLRAAKRKFKKWWLDRMIVPK